MLQIYPNPSYNAFNIVIDKNVFDVLSIYSSNGQLISTQIVTGIGNLSFGNDLPKGSYILELKGESVFYNKYLIKI